MKKILIVFMVIVSMTFAKVYPISTGLDVNDQSLSITFMETKEGLDLVIKDGVKLMKTKYWNPKTNKALAPWDGDKHDTFDVSIHYGDPEYRIRSFYPTEYKIKIIGNDCVLSFPKLEKTVMIKYLDKDGSNTPVTIKMILNNKLIMKVSNGEMLDGDD